MLVFRINVLLQLLCAQFVCFSHKCESQFFGKVNLADDLPNFPDVPTKGSPPNLHVVKLGKFS